MELRLWHDVRGNLCPSGSLVIPLLHCLDLHPPDCFGLGQGPASFASALVFLSL